MKTTIIIISLLFILNGYWFSNWMPAIVFIGLSVLGEFLMWFLEKSLYVKCRECYGSGKIEHIAENLVEDCEHCKGLGKTIFPTP